MKTQVIASALLAFAAVGNAMADEGFPYKYEPFVSKLTRAEVQAQVLQARKEGGLQVIGDAGKEPAFTSTAARSVVREQAVQSVRNHVVDFDRLGS